MKVLAFAVLAMAAVVTASNILVQYQINDLLTWGAFSYPVAFLITDLTNRALGSRQARKVVYVGFALAVLLSLYFADPRIAVASGSAFLLAQLLDISIFDRLRKQAWWLAPMASSTIASALDTFVFFWLAFAATGIPFTIFGIGFGETGVPWQTLALGDYLVKIGVALVMLIPFRLMLSITKPQFAAIKDA
ncbi:queuosine precursor transporter [Denitrobaculum tricleocarpae]|uniref:Probable queuosine precursor transporter n=2 Tax=Denitrobaculum tricleocarpae TaxID=2591009 RepID=A0A545TN52_9PROT|nr:queuosine precursor transporter [Denitrobaculum tricleocarpae]TQV78653.1 queuosine precursor transporter [Denitrobaculum tricleocarpae]